MSSRFDTAERAPDGCHTVRHCTLIIRPLKRLSRGFGMWARLLFEGKRKASCRRWRLPLSTAPAGGPGSAYHAASNGTSRSPHLIEPLKGRMYGCILAPSNPRWIREIQVTGVAEGFQVLLVVEACYPAQAAIKRCNVVYLACILATSNTKPFGSQKRLMPSAQPEVIYLQLLPTNDTTSRTARLNLYPACDAARGWRAGYTFHSRASLSRARAACAPAAPLPTGDGLEVQ